MKVFIIILLVFFLIGCCGSCASKPDVVVIDGNTYIFNEGVENFYIVDADGNKKEITD